MERCHPTLRALRSAPCPDSGTEQRGTVTKLLSYSCCRRGNFGYWFHRHREEVSCEVFQLTRKLLYYAVVFAMLEQSSLLQIDGIPVSWVYNRNGRSGAEDMRGSWSEGSNLELVVLLEIFTAFHRFFMGFRRDLNEVLGWKLNWEAVPYVGKDGIKEWIVWQLDFDLWRKFFYRRVRTPPTTFASCSKYGAGRAGGHCSLLRPHAGSGWMGTVWVASPPASRLSREPAQSGACRAVFLAWVHGGWLPPGRDGEAWGWAGLRSMCLSHEASWALLGLQVVFKSLLRAWLTGTIQPIKSN